MKYFRSSFFLVVIGIVVMFLFFEGCGKTSSSSRTKLLVYTTFTPMYAFTKAIGGDYIDVVCPLPKGEDPAFWTPPRNVLAAMQEKADLIIANGANFEKFIKRVDLPTDKLILTAGIFNTNELFRFHFTHSHGKAGKHSHIGINGHTWVSPVMAKKQAMVIRDALVSKDPAHKDEYFRNYIELSKKFDELSVLIKDALKNYKGEYIIVNHPAYDYLAKDFGFKIKDFGVHPDDVPDTTTLNKIIKFAREHKSKYMIWEERPTPEVEKVYKEKAGLEVVVFSPCENLSKDEDYFEKMKENIKNLKYLVDNM